MYATLPLITYSLHESVRCLSNAVRVFTDACVLGIEADAARCSAMMERSLMLVTALTPLIGYAASAKIAKDAMACGRTIREVALETGLVDSVALDKVLDPSGMV
jgi:fumarate hydratase class II